MANLITVRLLKLFNKSLLSESRVGRSLSPYFSRALAGYLYLSDGYLFDRVECFRGVAIARTGQLFLSANCRGGLTDKELG